ncbi:hypothetical protein Pla110_12500 [Polystyrenella longa]|uniref:DUF4340 domain-containing protein n=1 Tax=Polystyrenella longa TaxID=2528007 RepID=A0A518CJY1_9PLAN|nr:DUF4340 domain-containing protein [Polystyrenella longa]QDU79539.1 hypothetical protein Pla110_12500 [Polystyrenella longa]
MNQESKRTAIYVGLAAAALLIALWAEAAIRPAELQEFAKVGTEFYPEFKDPTEAASLYLYTYDEEKAESPEFSIVFKDGAYRIPRYNDYPADAEEKLAKTAASLIGLERDALAGRRSSEHERYGVIAPRSSESAKLEGRGSRITIKNEQGETLVDYIIGKQVEGETNQFYVRQPDEKETYKVRLDIDLSTKFSDWVDQDLLKISQSDLRDIELNRYSVDPQTGGLTQGTISELTRPDANSDWELAGFESEEQQVNQDQIRTMSSTLDNLELLGVRQKPQGVNANVEIDQSIVQNQLIFQGLVQDLASRGFYVAPNENEEYYLYADQGEVGLGASNGLAYTLRFGDVFSGSLEEIEAGFLSDGSKEEDTNEATVEAEASTAQGEVENPDETETESADENKSDNLKQGRYLFISVDFDESLLGEAPVEPTKPVKPETPAEEEKPADEPGSEEPVSEEEAAENSNQPAVAERPEDESAPEEEPPAEEATTEEESTEAETADPEAEYQAALEQYEADFQAYEAALEAYNQRKEDGQKKAAESNERFASWYYVISEESFAKLHVPQEDLLQPIGAEDAAGSAGQPQLPPGLNLPNFNLPQGN